MKLLSLGCLIGAVGAFIGLYYLGSKMEEYECECGCDGRDEGDCGCCHEEEHECQCGCCHEECKCEGGECHCGSDPQVEDNGDEEEECFESELEFEGCGDCGWDLDEGVEDTEDTSDDDGEGVSEWVIIDDNDK